MNRRLLLTVLALIPLALSGCASTGSLDDTKIGKLASSLGLTSEQAQAGVGAMLKLSQARSHAGAEPVACRHMRRLPELVIESVRISVVVQRQSARIAARHPTVRAA